MARSSILGGDSAAQNPDGRSTGLLGPSDSTDTGSDLMGQLGPEEMASDSDRFGTGERASVDRDTDGRGLDILPDHVGRMDKTGGIADEGGDFDPDMAADDPADLDLDPDDPGANPDTL